MVQAIQKDRVNPNIPDVDIDTGELSNGRAVSHGTASILKYLYDNHAVVKRPVYEYYLLNVGTILRNIHSTFRDQMSVKVLLDRLQQEMDMIKLFISQYSTVDTNNGLKIQLVFYHPSYSTIHDKYLKNLTASEKLVNTSLADLHKYYPDTVEVYDNIYIHHISVGKKTSPHIELNRYLVRQDVNANYKSHCMVSHIPLDYHFSSFSPKFSLLRSFTGDVRTRDMFGQMVFKYEVPFNKYTHLIYGDNKYIRPILSSTQKKKVEEIAKRNKWKYKTEHSIMEFLVKSGLVPMEYFKYSPI